MCFVLCDLGFFQILSFCIVKVKYSELNCLLNFLNHFPLLVLVFQFYLPTTFFVSLVFPELFVWFFEILLQKNLLVHQSFFHRLFILVFWFL